MTFKDWISTAFYNDSQNIPVYLAVFAVALLIFFCSIYFHELGHWLYFKFNLKKNVKIRFVFERISKFYWEAGEEKDYEGLTDKQYHGMLLTGIMMGTLPILVATIFWNPFIMLLIAYASGCWSDIKVMAEIGGKLSDEKEKVE